MNIFVLDHDPVRAAQLQCDKHVVKMILETAQLLCSPYAPNTAPYKRTHFNHPCAKWARTSEANYRWLLAHGRALCHEYTIRYHKTHKSQSILDWCQHHLNTLHLPSIGITPHPLCMPDDCKIGSPVESYRQYYKVHKRQFAVWKYSSVPEWW